MITQHIGSLHGYTFMHGHSSARIIKLSSLAAMPGFRSLRQHAAGRHKHGQHTQSMALSSSDGLGNVTLADMINTNGKDSINEEAKWW